MVFSSDIFLCCFLPATLVGYFLLARNMVLKNLFLCAASLFFYAYGEPFTVLVMLAFIALNWMFGLILAKKRNRWLLAFAVTIDLSILVVYKYLGFLVENFNMLLGCDLPVPQIALPIGISFFTFQTLSYVVDVYKRVVPAQRSLLKVGLYVSLFPQLIAGPIVRYSTIVKEIDFRPFRVDDMVYGVRRFILGLAKKVLLADRLAVVADFYFDAPAGFLNNNSATGLWLGAIAYMMQIYFDFSGYSDMAIGLGRMFGFKFEENFNQPYHAKSITDFWRRWHISLSG